MDYKTIPLTHGAVAIVSNEDYKEVSRLSWYLTSHGYAANHTTSGFVYLHRFVNNTPDGYSTDHINGNKLDCTRINLRTATQSQNCANASKIKNRTSQFKGVCIKPGCGKDPTKNVRWIAYITKEGKRTHLGYYATELDAAWAYNIAATGMFGEFSKQNQIPLDLLNRQKEPKRFQEPRHSRFIGVTKHKASGLWVSWVNKDGQKVHAKYFKYEEDAARDRDQAALRILGPSVKLNFNT